MTRSSAERQRDYRQRRNAGRAVLRVPVDEVELAMALIEAGLLRPAQEDDRTAITAAVEGLLAHFAEKRDA